MSKLASTAARLTAVVVLPTPPFWFAIAIILAIGSETGGSVALGWANLTQGRCSFYSNALNSTTALTSHVSRVPGHSGGITGHVKLSPIRGDSPRRRALKGRLP